MKILILGAGGIVGQHMYTNKPIGIDAIFARRVSEDFWYGIDYNNGDLINHLNLINPDVIINLAGENRVDIVESNPEQCFNINVNMVKDLCDWVASNGKYLIQCSTQGVFSGNNAPYNPSMIPDPITEYGKQKRQAEEIALSYNNTEVDRLTFVLGIRPFQNIGRRNPLEDMIEQEIQLQVNDRFFSPLFADEAAEILWERAINYKSNNKKIVHLGTPYKCSRFSIASDLKYNSCGNIKAKINSVSHEYFPGIAPRPFDTTWAYGTSLYRKHYDDALVSSYLLWNRIKNK
jgi:dTDP-4-dehydrorhamnose reductase